MSRLIVYGDSFIATTTKKYGWATLVANKLQITLIDRAISGSSIEKSMLLFSEDYKNNFFKKSDIIIFVFSVPGRLHLKYQNKYPHTASNFLRDDCTNSWYLENKDSIKWYLSQRDSDLYFLNINSYLHLFKSFTEQRRDIKFLFLSVNNLNNIIPLWDIPDNFLISYTSLWKISENEFNNITFEDWIDSYKTDVRINHLSLPNLKIISDLICEVLAKKDTSILSYDKFKKNLFDKKLNLCNYKEYIDNKLLLE